MALIQGGGYAQYAVSHELCTLPIPKGISVAEAAGIPETFWTVWHNVFQRGGLKSGEKLLVHGGSSGIGTTAIQLAKAFGAKVYTTVGSEDKRKSCTDLGADVVVNYRTNEDWDSIIKAEAGKGGIDLILDYVGGDYVNKNLD
jgi:NADPH2:quinone reductase